MAIYIPQEFDINPYACRWDTVDPHHCFDDNDCGCFMSPCDYFEVQQKDCELDASELCCTLVETC